jgi:hypothetical protein
MAYEELHCHKLDTWLSSSIILQQCSANAASLSAFYFSYLLQDDLGLFPKLWKFQQKSVHHPGPGSDRGMNIQVLSYLQLQIFLIPIGRMYVILVNFAM